MFFDLVSEDFPFFSLRPPYTAVYSHFLPSFALKSVSFCAAPHKGRRPCPAPLAVFFLCLVRIPASRISLHWLLRAISPLQRVRKMPNDPTCCARSAFRAFLTLVARSLWVMRYLREYFRISGFSQKSFLFTSHGPAVPSRVTYIPLIWFGRLAVVPIDSFAILSGVSPLCCFFPFLR